MFIYTIIGIIICAYGCTRLLDKGKYTEEEMFSNPAYLLAMLIIVTLWPVIVLWAVYEIIKEYKAGEL